MKSLTDYEEIPTKVSALEVDQTFDQTMKMLNQDQEDYTWNFHQLKSTIQDELEEENEKITYNYILKIQNNRIYRGEEFSKIEFQSSISSLKEVSNLNFCSLGVDGMNLHSIEGTDRIQIQSNGVYLYDREDADQSIASFNSENILFPEHTAISADLIQGTFGTSSIPNLDASKITSGTFSIDQIPNMNANKITEGTFDLQRIPDINAEKISFGTVSNDRLSEIPASKLTGTIPSSMIPDLSDKYAKLDANEKIDIENIPDLSSIYAPIIEGKIDVSLIPNLDASKITSGVFSNDLLPEIPLSKLSIDSDLDMEDYSISCSTLKINAEDNNFEDVFTIEGKKGQSTMKWGVSPFTLSHHIDQDTDLVLGMYDLNKYSGLKVGYTDIQNVIIDPEEITVKNTGSYTTIKPYQMITETKDETSLTSVEIGAVTVKNLSGSKVFTPSGVT